MTANNASVKDMEAASVAYIAEITHTPFLALKVVTDEMSITLSSI